VNTAEDGQDSPVSASGKSQVQAQVTKEPFLRICLLGKGGDVPESFSAQLEEWTGLTILTKAELDTIFAEAPAPEEGLEEKELLFRTTASTLRAFIVDPKRGGAGLEVPPEIKMEALARYLQFREAQGVCRGWILLDQPKYVNEARLLEHYLTGFKDDWLKEYLNLPDPEEEGVPSKPPPKKKSTAKKKGSTPVVQVEEVKKKKKPGPPHVGIFDAIFEIGGFEAEAQPETLEDDEGNPDLESNAEKSLKSSDSKSRTSTKESSKSISKSGNASTASSRRASDVEGIGLSLKMERMYSKFRGGVNCCRVDRENETDTYALETLHLLINSALDRKIEQQKYDEEYGIYSAEKERRQKAEEERKKKQEEEEAEMKEQDPKKAKDAQDAAAEPCVKDEGDLTQVEPDLPPLVPPAEVEGLNRRLEYDLIVRRVERRRNLEPTARLWMEMLTGERQIDLPALRSLMEDLSAAKGELSEQSTRFLAVLHNAMVDSNGTLRQEMHGFSTKLRSLDSRWAEILGQVRNLAGSMVDKEELEEEIEEFEAELGDVAEERHRSAEVERRHVEQRLRHILQELTAEAAEQLVGLESSERQWLQSTLKFVTELKDLLPAIPFKLETCTMRQTEKGDLKDPTVMAVLEEEEEEAEEQRAAREAEEIRQQLLKQYSRRSVYKTLGVEDIGVSEEEIILKKKHEDLLNQFALEEGLLQDAVKKLTENEQASVLAEGIIQAKLFLLEEASKVQGLKESTLAEGDNIESKDQMTVESSVSLQGDLYFLEVLVAYMVRLRSICTRFDAFQESCSSVLKAGTCTLLRMSAERTSIEHATIHQTMSLVKQLLKNDESISNLPKKMDVDDWICFNEDPSVVADAGPLHLPLGKIYSLSQKLRTISGSRPLIGSNDFRDCLASMCSDEAFSGIWKEPKILDRICQHLDPRHTQCIDWRRLIHLLVCSHLPALPTLEDLHAMGEKVGLRTHPLPIRLAQYYFVRSTWYFEFKPEEGGKPEPQHVDPKVATRIKEIYSNAWSEEDGKIDFSNLLVTWCALPLRFLPGQTQNSTVFSEGLYRAFCLLGNTDSDKEKGNIPLLTLKQLEAIFSHKSSPVVIDVSSLIEEVSKEQNVQVQHDGSSIISFEQALTNPQVKSFALQNGLSLQSLISICLSVPDSII